MSASEADEGGIRPQRLEFVRESTRGETPADPAWEPYSDAFQSVSFTPDASPERQDAMGAYLPQGFFANNEIHEGSVTYHQQRWFVDGSGNPVDAATDAIERNADNQVLNTHTVVKREEHSVTGGTADAGRRIYYVGVGGRIGTAELPLETDRSLPIATNLSYTFEKVRAYDCSQPSGSLASTGTVESTDAADTTQTLTLEDEGAAATEDISLNGTSTVTITAALSDIDAAELDAETKGDVLIKDGSGNTLLTIYGQDHYEHGEGDLGIPALGAGSHAAAIGTDYEIFSGDAFTATSGSLGGPGARIITSTVTVENALGDDPQAGTARRKIWANEQTLTTDVTFAGPVSNATTFQQHVDNTTIGIQWTADGGTVDLTGGTTMDGGEAGGEANQGRSQISGSYEFSNIALST